MPRLPEWATTVISIAVIAAVTFAVLSLGVDARLVLAFGAVAAGIAATLTAVSHFDGSADFSRGIKLGEAGQREDAIAAFDRAADRLAASGKPVAKVRLARAVFNKAIMLKGLGRTEDELVVLDEFLDRFAGSAHPVVQRLIARAMFNRAVALSRLHRSGEAADQYRAIVSRFGGATDPELREPALWALANLGDSPPRSAE
jgi:tetratricopeptide (TPR) repeat protein